MIIAFLIGLALQSANIQLGDKKLTVEIADTEESRIQGLMDRYHLDQNRGMLFIFDILMRTKI
jgi:uncharacterized membrane protein (UPF0127 family)